MFQVDPRVRVGVIAFVVFLASSAWEFPRGSDGAAMLATAESVVDRGTLAIGDRFTTDDGYNPSAKRGTDGRPYGKYGLGLSLLEVPLLAAAPVSSRYLDVSEARARAVILSLLSPFFIALSTALIWATCLHLDVSPDAAQLAAFGYAFGSLAWPYAVSDFSEALQSCLVATAGWGLVVFERTLRQRSLWIAGGALAWGILTKITIAVLVPPFVLAVWLSSRSAGDAWPRAFVRSAGIIAPTAAAVAVIGWLNWLRFGSILETGYNTPVLTHPLGHGLYGLLVSPNKGLVFFAPQVMLAPFAARALWRRSRRFAIAMLAGMSAWILLNAKFYDWGGGWSWGPRYLVPVLPLFFVTVGVAAGRPALRGLARVLFVAGFAVNLLGVLVSEDAFRRTTMRVWVTARTGYETAGSTASSATLVSVPRPPEDVLPAFSSIAGHWWLLRVRLAGCECDTSSGDCACRTGPFEVNRTFLSPPWRAEFPEAIPLAPYGTSIIQPLLLRKFFPLVPSP
jgi:hypothetical protein